MARKWDGNSADKPVLDYSQKEDGEAAAGDRQDISQPLADLSLRSRVDEFDDDEEGERTSANQVKLLWSSIQRLAGESL